MNQSEIISVTMLRSLGRWRVRLQCQCLVSMFARVELSLMIN